MRIAICDDDLDFADQLHDWLREADPALKDTDITILNNGFKLTAAFDEKYRPFHLILLDIEMPFMDGLEAAREIRRQDQTVQIILITAFVKYSLRGYSVQPYHYLMKPLNKAHFMKVFQAVREKLLRNKDEFLFVNEKELRAFVPFEDIYYIEGYNKNVRIHTPDRKIINRRTMYEVEGELFGRGFYKPHLSYLVNFRYIHLVDKENNMIIMTNGERIPISFRLRTKFLKALMVERGIM